MYGLPEYIPAAMRPRYADLAPGDWQTAARYGWAELKYDGEYCELKGNRNGWELRSRRGELINEGPESLPACHLLCEHIVGTEWAYDSGLYGSLVAWGAVSRNGHHLPRATLRRHVEALRAVGINVVKSERFALSDAPAVWDRLVVKGGFEGLVFRTKSGRFSRMKARATLDYVATDYDGVSITGALYNRHGKLLDKVRVPYDGDVTIGDVIEASGLRVTSNGSLRNPRFERFRVDKAAEECTTASAMLA